MKINQTIISKFFVNLGITEVNEIIYNPSYDQLFQEETDPKLGRYERGIITTSGAIAVDTGIFTGRSPKDKYIVKDETTNNTIWWNDKNTCNSDNHPISQEVWVELKKCVIKELSNKRIFVIDAFCGSNKNTRIKVRFVSEVAWQAHFVKNMFIMPNQHEMKNFIPDFVVLNAAKATNANWKKHKLNSENFVAFNLTENIQLIGGTWYGGEMKKGLFSVMNYLLPLQNIASMHCSANIGNKKDVAIFFGLSGTGKTTLSTDPNRKLIGDDEHGWDNNGIFNLEGGCYAKTIKLSYQNEPAIYNAIRRNALLENVVVNANGNVDWSDSSKTENTRVSYPINHINNIAKPELKIGHAKKVIFLTADAFGVLPPVSYLTIEQIQYYFLSGFTAKLAGTERGIKNPIPTFSACFGSAFLTLHPIYYAKLLLNKVIMHQSKAYLVNTGWNGQGARISLKKTRTIINMILSDKLDQNYIIKETLPIFNLQFPKAISDVNNIDFDPRKTWQNEQMWYNKACFLAELFIQNFAQYNNIESAKFLKQAGPQI